MRTFTYLTLFLTTATNLLSANNIDPSRHNYSNHYDLGEQIDDRVELTIEELLIPHQSNQNAGYVLLSDHSYSCASICVLSPLHLVGTKSSRLVSRVDRIGQEMFRVTNTTMKIESTSIIPTKEAISAKNSDIFLDTVTLWMSSPNSLVISLNSHITLSSITFKHRTSHSTIDSLVRNEENSGTVTLASTSINDMILGSSEPLVASSSTLSTQIAWSAFTNISMSTADQTQPPSETSQKTRMIGCETDSVCCVHDGTITRSINTPGSFVFSNNTFAHTDRSNAPTTYTGEKTARIKPTVADVLFDRCAFTNCFSTTEHGGAISSYVVGQTVTITSSSFLSCYVLESHMAGGGVYLNQTTTSISNTKFVSCRGFWGGACAIHPYKYLLSFTNNNCTSCTAECEPTFHTDTSTGTIINTGNRYESNVAKQRACFLAVFSTAEISNNLFTGNTHIQPELTRATLELSVKDPKSLLMHGNKFEGGNFIYSSCNGTIKNDIRFFHYSSSNLDFFATCTNQQLYFPSSSRSNDTLTSSDTSNIIYAGTATQYYSVTASSQSPFVQFSRAASLAISSHSFDFSAKGISFGAFAGHSKVIIDSIKITPNSTALKSDFISLSTASLIVRNITLSSLPVSSFSFIRMAGESSFVVSSSNFSNFVQTSAAGGSFVVMDGSATQHTKLSSCRFSSLRSTGNGGVLLATLTTESTLSVEDCVFSSCSSGGNGGAISVSCAAVVASSSLVVKSTFTSCSCGSEQKGQWVFVEGSTFLTLLKRENWLSTVSSLTTPTDDNLLWGTDNSELEGSKYRSMTLLYYLIPYRNQTITAGPDGRDEDGCGRLEWECKSLEVGASHLSGTGSHKLIVTTSTTLTTPLSFSTNAIEICPNEATASITTGTEGRFAISAFTLTLTSLSFDGQSVERSTSLLEISGSGSIVVSGCSFSSLVKDGDGSIFSSSLNSGNSLTFKDANFSSCLSRVRGGALAVTLNGGSYSMTDPIRFVSCSSTQSEGDWISITSADLVTFLSSSLASLKPLTQTTPYSRLEKKKWFGVDAVTSSEGSLLFYWYPHTSTCESTHIHADGEDHALCGRELLPCSSFNRTLSHPNQNNTFVIDSAVTLNEELTIAADTILTSSTSQQTIATTSAASVTIGQKSLTLLDLSFTGHPRSAPFISLSSACCIVIIDGCSFSSLTLTTAIIEFAAGSLSLTSTKFHQITRSDGNGSVLEVEMVEGMKLEIDAVELSDVTTQNGVANGFFISFTSISDQSKIPAFCLRNLKYSSSSSSNSNGAFVWVEGNNLDEWIAYEDTRFAGSFETGVSYEWLWSVDHATSLNASLLFYLLAGSGGIGVASDGLDLEKCGHNSVWCRTLEHSLTRASKVPTNHLHVMGEVSVGNEVEMGGVTVKGLPVMSSIVLSSSGCLREETGDTVQFESVTVVLKEGGRSSAALVVLFGHMNLSMVEISVLADQTTPLFKSVNSILTLQTITISSSHNVGTLMDCEKGTVSVNSLVSANISFASTPIRLSDLRSATLIQLQVSNTSDLVFLECSNITTLSLQSCSFEGPIIPTQASHNEHESLCEWTTGVITIVDSTVSIKNSDFSHLSQGALFLSNTHTTIHSSVFSSNIGESSQFPSARKNIRCQGGEVVVDSLNGGDGSKDHPSAWISLDSECRFSSQVIEPFAVFFIPTLTSSESPASFNKTSQMYTLTLSGSLLLDCNLRLNVFSLDEKKGENGSIQIPLSPANTMNWTESSFSTQLASSALSSLDSKMEWRCRIVFGDGFKTDSTLLKRSASDERKAQFASVRKWLIPVIITSSALLLLFFIVLIVILVRRRNKQKKENEQLTTKTEMDEQLPAEKLEVEDSFAPTLVNTTANLQKVNPNEFDEGGCSTSHTQQQPMDRDKPVENDGKFEAVNCSDVSEKVFVNWKDTLYRRLHSGENRMIGAERATIAQQLTRGLLNLAQKDPTSLGLRNVSTHWIVFDWTNQMYLQIGEARRGESVAASQTRNTKQDSAGVEGQRWIAPELMDEESNKKHDHGAVFSLGLILWELETGLVPFGELDAANAQRQLGCGGQLPMTKISSLKLVELIEKCLDLDPTGRPTLAEVLKELGEDGLFTTGTILQDDPLGCDF